jgi:hypothetical protein
VSGSATRARTWPFTACCTVATASPDANGSTSIQAGMRRRSLPETGYADRHERQRRADQAGDRDAARADAVAIDRETTGWSGRRPPRRGEQRDPRPRAGDALRKHEQGAARPPHRYQLMGGAVARIRNAASLRSPASRPGSPHGERHPPRSGGPVQRSPRRGSRLRAQAAELMVHQVTDRREHAHHHGARWAADCHGRLWECAASVVIGPTLSARGIPSGAR